MISVLFLNCPRVMATLPVEEKADLLVSMTVLAIWRNDETFLGSNKWQAGSNPVFTA
jgi:hypothetical protein